jgi:hypothetical protein
VASHGAGGGRSGSKYAPSHHSFHAFTQTIGVPKNGFALAFSISLESHASYFGGVDPAMVMPAPCLRASLSQLGMAVLMSG